MQIITCEYQTANPARFLKIQVLTTDGQIKELFNIISSPCCAVSALQCFSASLDGRESMFVMNRLTNLWCRLKNIKFPRSNYQTDSSETSLLFTTKVSSARQFTNHIKLLPTFSDESLDSQMKKKTVKNPPLTISIVYFLQARLFTIHPGIRTGTMGCHISPLNFLWF